MPKGDLAIGDEAWFILLEAVAVVAFKAKDDGIVNDGEMTIIIFIIIKKLNRI